jgi:uncharacterized Zn finger protein
MSLPELKPSHIRQGASDESFARGVSYFHQGAVGELVLRGDLLQADVSGSAYEPYRVSVVLADDGVRSAGCSCPYDWGGWCKHIVATLLAYINAGRGEVQLRPPLSELLAGFDREQLLALLLRLAEHDPTLADRIERLIAPTPLRSAPALARPASADVPTFRRQLRRAFASPDDDYGASSRVVAALEPLAEQIDGLIAGENPEAALPLLEALTEEYGGRWLEYDDSDGELGAFFDDLGQLWAEALLEADLPRGEREAWVHRLGEWNDGAADYGIEGLEVALRAAEEGWDAPWLGPALRGEPVALELDDWATEALLPIRLRVLERKGLTRDALNLAVVSGRRREQALLLVSLGQTDAAIALARGELQTADDLLALATVLRERGDGARALLVGELGLGKSPPRAPLAIWLFDLATAEGRVELALRAGEAALREAPELGLFQRMRSVAGEQWPATRERLLQALRATSVSWQTARGLVDIWLHEGLVDDAIKVVGQGAAGGELMRVVDAATPSHPAWAISAATAQAEAIMNGGDAARYGIAIEWLRRARAGHEAAGQTAAWDAYLQALRAKHRRKYKLMELIDHLERQR